MTDSNQNTTESGTLASSGKRPHKRERSHPGHEAIQNPEKLLPQKSSAHQKKRLNTGHEKSSPAKAKPAKNTASDPQRAQADRLKQRRWEKKKQIWLKRLRTCSKLASAVGVFFVLLWVWSTPLWQFDGQTVSLRNATVLTQKAIAPLVKPFSGKPLYAIDTGLLAQQLAKRFDIINYVSVRRVLFPSPRLDIQVVEKKPWAILYRSSEQLASKSPYALLANTDRIDLKPIYLKPTDLKPNVYETALNLTPIVLTERLTDNQMSLLQQITQHAKSVPGMQFQFIDFSDASKLVLKYKEIPVILGKLNPSSLARLSRLPVLVPKIKDYQAEIDAVDLQWEKQITFQRKA
ncbi:MAG: hypothetical protein AAGI66_02445 [Cyanobacteria bacterium P01_H01_bin.74]